MTTTTAAKQYNYKGWTFHQVKRQTWILTRKSDGYTTRHNTYGGCKSFINLHGNAANPDDSYDSFVNSRRLISSSL